MTFYLAGHTNSGSNEDVNEKNLNSAGACRDPHVNGKNNAKIRSLFHLFVSVDDIAGLC